MAKRLFIAGLPWSVEDAELSDVFSKFGKVNSATVIKDRETGRSKGFGFVEMAEDAEAEKAKAELNGSKMGERDIIVNDARPMEDRGGDRPRGNFGSDRRGGFDRNRGGYGGGGGGGFRRGDRGNDRGDRRGSRGR